MKRLDIMVFVGMLVCSFLFGMLIEKNMHIVENNESISYCDFYLNSNGKYYPHTLDGLQQAVYDLNNSDGETVMSVSLPCSHR